MLGSLLPVVPVAIDAQSALRMLVKRPATTVGARAMSAPFRGLTRGRGRYPPICSSHVDGAPDDWRPKSKVYLNSLLENIESLEHRIREAGLEPPQLPQKVTRTQPSLQYARPTHSSSEVPPLEAATSENHSDTARSPNAWPLIFSDNHAHESPASADAVLISHRSPGSTSGLNLSKPNNTVRPRSASNPPRLSNRKSTVWNLIYGNDRLIYDKRTGRVSYLSASTSYKIFIKDHAALESTHLDKQSYRILADIPADLESYLMDLFWNQYNNTLRVVDQVKFKGDQSSGGTTYYSGLLHLVCLAMGFHYADKTRPGMQQITAEDKQSVFWREAKYMLDRELNDPGGLTTIQAMLILSDLECACGRDDSAALYITISCHLAFQFGLNIDCSSLNLPESKTKFRKDVLRSCIIYDQAWALHLGRPTNIKLADVASPCLNTRSSNSGESALRPPHAIASESTSSEDFLIEQILDALLELSELSSKIQGLAQPMLSPDAVGDEGRLVDVAMLDNKLKSWYSSLPPRLTWTPENVQDAPRAFFLIHQQYHVSQLVLYGPYGRYEDAVGVEPAKSPGAAEKSSETSESNWMRDMARSITMKAAMNIVRGFTSYRQKFGTCQTNVFALQQAGTAFLALMCSTKASTEREKRILGLQHLYWLMEQLREMSHICYPAQIMCRVIKHEMEQLGLDFAELPATPYTQGYNATALSTTADRGTKSPPSSSFDAGPTRKRPRLSMGQDDPAATITVLPHSSLTQNMPSPSNPSLNQFRDIGQKPTSPSSLNVLDGRPSGTSPGDRFGSMMNIADPVLDLGTTVPNLPPDYSQTPPLFDFQGHNMIGNDFLDLFLPNSRFLDALDPHSKLLPGVRHFG
ncbi:Fungal specific transcription factor domain-containing protein [Cladophialophora immunda]|nr:Fungal specific transcription factor domain-containing protein [Cladophialophora immunda]